MSRTFLNQSTQIGSSRVHDDTLVPGPELEFTGSESSIHDDLNALRSMTQEVLGTTNWYDSPVNTIMGLDSGKLSLTGGTMSGTLDMGGFVISNVATPITGTDTVNLDYLNGATLAAHFRYSKEYAVVLSQVLSGTDLIVNPVDISGVNTNPTLGVDASLAIPFWYDFSTNSPMPPDAPGNPLPGMVADFNLYSNLHLNGQLLRYGPDFEFGSTAGTLRFAFDLEANDVICLISDQYPGLPALGGGGGGGSGYYLRYSSDIVSDGSGGYTVIIRDSSDTPLSGLSGTTFIHPTVGNATVPLLLGAQTTTGGGDVAYTVQSGGSTWHTMISTSNTFDHPEPLAIAYGNESPDVNGNYMVTRYIVDNKDDVTMISLQIPGIDYVGDVIGDTVSHAGENRTIVGIAGGYGGGVYSIGPASNAFSSQPIPYTTFVGRTPAASGTVIGYVGPKSDGNMLISIKGVDNLVSGSTITFSGETMTVIGVTPGEPGDTLYSTDYRIAPFTTPPAVGISTVTVATGSGGGGGGGGGESITSHTVSYYSTSGVETSPGVFANGIFIGLDGNSVGYTGDVTITYGGESRTISGGASGPVDQYLQIWSSGFTTAPSIGDTVTITQ